MRNQLYGSRHRHGNFDDRYSSVRNCFRSKVRIFARGHPNRWDNSYLSDTSDDFIFLHSQIPLSLKLRLIRLVATVIPYIASFGSASGNRSSLRANHVYRVGNRKMLMSSPATSPPTMTMAKGRWESDPMPWESAAGRRPRVATNIVIMMGRSRRTAPSTAASSIEYPRARSWLMYSSMITPVCTDTPK